jgi:APA family basic amino acid/polyamine antiporter
MVFSAAQRASRLEPKKLDRSIGLFGAAATLVGYVVGASIFILPGQLAPSTGPALFLAFLIASIPALLSCFVTAQIGCAYPESGAPYVAASRNLSPFWGFMLVWSLLTGASIGIPLIAYSFADYLAFFVTDLNTKAVALTTVGFFAIINLLGARISVKAQGAMVLGFVAALLVFGLGGLPHVELANFRPMFPNGFGPVLGAAIPAYFSFVGFSMIADLAGEIDRPGWTIPRALGIAFLCIIFFYTLVPLTLVGVVHWSELGAMNAAVAEAARLFTPEIVASLISVGALLAAATSLNGILLAISRDVFALAEDRIFPQQLGELSGRQHIPRAAILTVATVGFIGTAVGATITGYALAAVMSIMLLQILSAAAVFALPKRSPERFAKAAFRLHAPWNAICSVGLILVSLLFIGLGVAQDPGAAVIFVGLILVGATYYAVRKAMLRRQGLQIEDVLRKDRLLAAAD